MSTSTTETYTAYMLPVMFKWPVYQWIDGTGRDHKDYLLPEKDFEISAGRFAIRIKDDDELLVSFKLVWGEHIRGTLKSAV